MGEEFKNKLLFRRKSAREKGRSYVVIHVVWLRGLEEVLTIP